jgi:hypothetical protein
VQELTLVTASAEETRVSSIVDYLLVQNEQAPQDFIAGLWN